MYIGVYPVLMIGLLLLVRRRNQRADGPGVVDSVIMSVGLSLVSFLFLMAPYIHDGTMSLIPKLVSIAYPTGDLILLAAAIRLAVDAGKRRPSFYLLIASIVTLLLTDFVYGILTLNGTYTHQLWLDAGWIFFYLLWGAAALHPVDGRALRRGDRPRVAPHQPAPRPARRRDAHRAGARADPHRPPPRLGRRRPHRDVDRCCSRWSSAAWPGWCASARRRPRASAPSRAAGGLLVGATDRNEIVIAALQAVVELGGDQVDARLCRITGESVRVLAIDERGGLATGRSPARSRRSSRNATPAAWRCCPPTRASSCVCRSARTRSWGWSCARATTPARC